MKLDTHNTLPLTQERFPCGVDGKNELAPLESRLHAAVESCYRHAEIHFQRRFDRPHLALNLRGMAAAVTQTTKNEIRINRLLLEQNTEDFLHNTVPHEVSHLLAYRLCDRKITPHGKEWATIMREVFGLTPARCHQYAVSPRKSVTYRYHCDCAAGHALGARRHNSALRGRRYFCRRCRQPLNFSHREGTNEE